MSDSDEVSMEEIPLYQVVVDWGAFDRLSDDEKKSFVDIVQKMENAQWFARADRPIKEWACIDLLQYSTYNDFVKELKKSGKSYYEAKKAEKRGYYTKFFEWRSFIGDIVAINTSMPERQGRPMGDAYLRTVEQMGGYPSQFIEPAPPSQNVFWHRNFGTFRPSPDHSLGPFTVDEELISYLVIRRYGDFAHYGTILGHKDCLHDGVVHKMHLDFIKAILDTRDKAQQGDDVDVSLLGLRFVSYASYFSFPGLMRWKKSNLFKPGYFSFDFTHALKLTEATQA